VHDADRLFTTDRKWSVVTTALVGALHQFHAARPLEPGVDMEAVREQLPIPVTAKAFRAVVSQLETERAVAREGNLLRVPDHRVALPSEEQAAAARIRALLGRTPLAPPDPRQMAADLGLDGTRLMQVLRVLERERVVVRVAGDIYFLRQTVEDVTRALREQFGVSDTITPGMFRDRFQTTRKYAIPLLEHLDREGVTVRAGDTRRLRAWQKSPAASGQSS
jgi:selenocysteine-specific elongation factor